MEIRRKSIEEGMITLRASGLEKLRQGMTTIEEVLRESVG
jgi:type IV pilus assembly protein PilB